MLGKGKVFLFGFSGHAFVIIESFLSAGYSSGGYFDYYEARNNPYQIPYLGFEENVDIKSIIKDDFVFPCVGDNLIRARLISFFERYGLNQCTLIDSSAIVSSTVKLGVSTYVGKGTIVNSYSQIGKGVILNSAAIVEHECEIKDFVHVAPGAVLCGNVKVGFCTFIGSNSVIINNISIFENVIIGAGSVVIKSIKENGIWVGNPSKKNE